MNGIRIMIEAACRSMGGLKLAAILTLLAALLIGLTSTTSHFKAITLQLKSKIHI